jgi:hypothetical protein
MYKCRSSVNADEIRKNGLDYMKNGDVRKELEIVNTKYNKNISKIDKPSI